jgi:uncharacterized protein
VRFWDTSALVPLLVAEPGTPEVRELIEADEEIVVWWGSRVECLSALRRTERDGAFDAADVQSGIRALDALSRVWSVVEPLSGLRVRAERALAVHPLSAADALQLAAGITWRADSTERHEFVCRDARLRDAASREGFALLPAE